MGSTGRVTNSVTAMQTAQVRKVSNRIRNYKKEQYFIINENGDVVLKKQGAQDSVAVSVGEKRDLMGGAVSLHNHPEGGTFSSSDLSDFGFGARAIYVASPDGDYVLENLNYGTSQQSQGWVGLRDAMENSGVYAERSYMTLRSQAEATPEVRALQDRASVLASQWVQRRDSGASQSELNELAQQHTSAQQAYSEALRETIRRLETQPAHDFLSEHASEYGFRYTYRERG